MNATKEAEYMAEIVSLRSIVRNMGKGVDELSISAHRSLATIDNINKLIAIHSEANEGVEYELLPPSREEATSCIMSTGLITTHYGAEQPARLKATITTVKPIL